MFLSDTFSEDGLNSAKLLSIAICWLSIQSDERMETVICSLCDGDSTTSHMEAEAHGFRVSERGGGVEDSVCKQRWASCEQVESPGVVGSWQYEGIPRIRQTPRQHLHHGCGPRTAHHVAGVEGGGRPEHAGEQSCHSLRKHGWVPLSHASTSISRRPVVQM